MAVTRKEGSERMSRKASKDDVIETIRKAEEARELGKQHYAEADRLVKQIRRHVKPGQIVDLPDGRQAVLIDKLKRGEVSAFCPAVFRRYELKVKLGTPMKVS